MTLAKNVQKGKMIHKIVKVEQPEIEGDPNDDNSPLTFTITTDHKDRDLDIVDPAGIKVDNYAKNAVMQFAHQYDKLPVGKSVEMFATKVSELKDGAPKEFNAIKARVIFQPDSNYQKNWTGLTGSMIRRMYISGFLNAVSIGFNPLEWSAIEDIEEKDNKTSPELMDLMPNAGTKFNSWELLEFSAVPVPANPQALIDRDNDGTFKKMLKDMANTTLAACEGSDCPRDKANGVWTTGDTSTHTTTLPLIKNKSIESEEFNVIKEIAELEKKILEFKELLKQGRVLSAANEADLKKAAVGCESVCALIEGVVSQVTGTPYEAPEQEAQNQTVTKGNETSGIKPEVEAEVIEVAEVVDVVSPDETEIIDTTETIETPIESDDDIIIVDEDELLAVINEAREANVEIQMDSALDGETEQPTEV